MFLSGCLVRLLLPLRLGRLAEANWVFGGRGNVLVCVVCKTGLCPFVVGLPGAAASPISPRPIGRGELG